MPQPVLVYTRIAANKRNTRLLLVLFLLAFLPVVLAIVLPVLPMILLPLVFVVALAEGDLGTVGGPAGAIYYLLILIAVIGAGVKFVASLLPRFGSRMILRAARATPLGPHEEPELVRTVENLCIAAGLPVPRIYLIDSPVPNAFATGRDPERASLAVTRGLLKLLDHRELEGVVAHELSHIGNHDIQLTTALAALVSVAILPFSMSAAARAAMVDGEIRFSSESVILLLAMLAGTGFFVLGSLQWDGGGWWWMPAYLLFISPVGALFTRTAVLWQREFLADADAVLLTRDPEGLALALVKITAARGNRLRVGEGCVHLYFADPLAEDDSLIHRMFPSHPPVEKRIELLARMGSGIARADLQRAREAGVTAAPMDSTSIGVEIETPRDALQRQEVTADTDRASFGPSDEAGRDDSERISLTPLYEQPDGWSRVLRRLPVDAVVTAVGRQGAFIRVLTNDGVTGYVSSLAPLAVVKEWSGM